MRHDHRQTLADAQYRTEAPPSSARSSETRRRVTPATRVSDALVELGAAASLAGELGFFEDDGGRSPDPR